MSDKLKLAELRRDYQHELFSELNLAKSPIIQFKKWLKDIIATNCADPTAMVLSTVNAEGYPDSRVVLLKGIQRGRFIFYTNYQSTKGAQIAANSHVALNFYWPELDRQIRVQGTITKTTYEESNQYFKSRPYASQISAIISEQSKIIPNRNFLEEKLQAAVLSQAVLTCPEHWGGYRVNPHNIEFWQGRENRLHDRIVYQKQNKSWLFHRLAP